MVVCRTLTLVTAMVGFMDLLSIIKDIVVIIATFALPWYGLRTWRRELIGKRDSETAMALMKAIYKVRNTLEHAAKPTYTRTNILLSIKNEIAHQIKRLRHGIMYILTESVLWLNRWRNWGNAVWRRKYCGVKKLI